MRIKAFVLIGLIITLILASAAATFAAEPKAAAPQKPEAKSVVGSQSDSLASSQSPAPDVNTPMHSLSTEVVRGVFTLLAVIIGSTIALRGYFRQKEYELTKQRYLEEGIDLVEASLKDAIGVLSHNYARSLELCRAFKNLGAKISVAELDKGYIALSAEKFQQIAHTRVSTLTGTALIWEIYQEALADIEHANSVISHEIPNSIRVSLEKGEALYNHNNSADLMAKTAREQHDVQFRYQNFFIELHRLGVILERVKMSLKFVAKFQNKKDVQEILEKLRSEFKKEA